MRKDRLHWPSYGLALGGRLRALRTARGLSQYRLAELSGLSRNQISNLERNENNHHSSIDPLVSTMYRLANVLDVPPVALLPRAGGKVLEICHDPELGVEVDWPEKNPEIRRFSEAFIVLGEPGEKPEYCD